MTKQKLHIIKKSPHVDRVKFELTRNLFTFLAILLGVLGIINLIQNDINMYPLLAGSLLCGLILLLLIKTKNHKIAAKVAVALIFLMTIYNMMVTSNFGHFVDFFWIVCIVVYIFFVLDIYWGTVSLFLNIGVVVTIQLLDQYHMIDRVDKEFTSFSQINYIINIVVSGIVFTYVIYKVLTALRKTEEDYLSANKELVKSNEEKTIMLKEIHHRVKNNLQVITSLLRLQLHEIEDEKSRHHFIDSINRVAAMAIIHEKMYQTESLSKIDLASYLQTLIDDLISSYARLTEIETRITSNVNHMEPESIVPLALIFNELISNTLEHGFANMAHGIINIDVQKNSNGITVIHYSDNGKWKDPVKEYSFGIELIDSFTEQLDGICRRESLPTGTHYHFEFTREL
ncbi:MAG: sensor histidine kinase [Crocinitomicaceae bacterium]|nr:sensor histidine kinase [Crocinitomicaceae bacterium]